MIRAVTENRSLAGVRNAIISLAYAMFLGACGSPEAGPEEQVRQWVSLLQATAEAKERRELVDMISPAYVDSRGNDRGDIETLLRLYFLRQHSVTLLMSIEELRVYGDSAAEVELTVGMTGTNDGVFGFSADVYRFQLELERDAGDWLLISARWGELGKEPH